MLFKQTLKATAHNFIDIYGGTWKGVSIFVYRLFLCGAGKHKYFHFITQNRRNKFFSNDQICFYCGHKKRKFAIKQRGYSLVINHANKKDRHKSNEKLKSFKYDNIKIEKEEVLTIPEKGDSKIIELRKRD